MNEERRMENLALIERNKKAVLDSAVSSRMELAA